MNDRLAGEKSMSVPTAPLQRRKLSLKTKSSLVSFGATGPQSIRYHIRSTFGPPWSNLSFLTRRFKRDYGGSLDHFTSTSCIFGSVSCSPMADPYGGAHYVAKRLDSFPQAVEQIELWRNWSRNKTGLSTILRFYPAWGCSCIVLLNWRVRPYKSVHLTCTNVLQKK